MARASRDFDGLAFDKLSRAWAPVLDWYDGSSCPVDGADATCSLVGPLVDAWRAFAADWQRGKRSRIGDQWAALTTIRALQQRGADELTERARVALATVESAPVQIGPIESLAARWAPVLEWYDAADPLCPCRTHVACFVAAWRKFCRAPFDPADRAAVAGLVDQWVGYWTTRALWRSLVAGADEVEEAPLDPSRAVPPAMLAQLRDAAAALAPGPAQTAQAEPAAQPAGGVKRMRPSPDGIGLTADAEGHGAIWVGVRDLTPEVRAAIPDRVLGEVSAQADGDLGFGSDAGAPTRLRDYVPAFDEDHPTAEAETSYQAIKRRWDALVTWGVDKRAPEDRVLVQDWAHFSHEWESFAGHPDASALRAQEAQLLTAESHAADHGYVPAGGAYVPPAGQGSIAGAGPVVHTPDPDRATSGTQAAWWVAEHTGANPTTPGPDWTSWLPWILLGGAVAVGGAAAVFSGVSGGITRRVAGR